MFDGQDKEKGALEKLNEIAMEMQEMEESMAFMDEYAQKFYKLAIKNEYRKPRVYTLRHESCGRKFLKNFLPQFFFEAKYAKMRQYVIFDEDIRIMI